MIDDLKKHWASTVIAASVIASAWLWFARPAVERAGEARATLERLEREAEAAERAPAEPRRGLPSEPLENLGFGESSLTGVQDRLYELARHAGVQILRLEPERGATSTRFGVLTHERRLHTVEAEGAYADIAGYLSALRDDPMAVVEEFSLSTSRRNGRTGVIARVRTGEVGRAGGAVAEGSLE